jgi:MFS family permease
MPKATRRNLLAICLATVAWSFNFGLGTQAISHWLKAWLHGREDSNTVIGLNLSTYYLGMALAALAVPRLTKCLGNLCAPAGMILSGLSLTMFPWGDGLAGWFVLRLVNGMAGAMSLVPLETVVSRDAPLNQRTRNFSFYAVALTVGGAAGIWAGNHFYSPGSTFVFFLGGLFPVVAGLALAGTLAPTGTGALTNQLQGTVGWSRHLLSYGTAWFQGFLEGGMVAFLVLYLESLGISQDQAGGLMSVTMVGVILFQVPVAWLADHLGRLPVLLGCYAVVAGGLVLMPFWSPSIGLIICLFLLGACAGALYPLALALLGDRPHQAGLDSAFAFFLAMECVGNLAGAAVTGHARDTWGEASMFGAGLGALALVLISWALVSVWQRRRHHPVDRAQ